MPSLYETTAVVGDVSSSNFTTLYNASNLTVPNAGAGSVSGNLNVAGNLTVQGSSLLIGPVVLSGPLTLPNYSFPLNDGTTDQVLTTDGNGNTYWTSISSLGANYNIQAGDTTGGANLSLVSSTGTIDNVKFASGDNTTVTRVDANTIKIDSTGQSYAIDAAATTGGALLDLTGSGGSTDSVKFASGTNTTVTQIDANTIGFASVDTKYNINAGLSTGGTYLTLTGSDGSADRVKFTNGTNISIVKTDDNTITINNTQAMPTVPTYNIDAAATTGGALLDLTNSSGATDSVKFASGSNIAVTQTDANTITITGTVAPLPTGAQGNVLTNNGTAWVASSVVETAISGNRLAGSYISSTPGVQAGIWSRKNFGATNYVSGDGASIAFQVKSDAQGTTTMAALGGSYDATTPALGMSVSTDNYATKTQINKFTANDASFNGGRLTLNYNVTGAPSLDASFIANRGTGTAATLTWKESAQRWEFNNGLYVGGNITTPYENIFINSDSTAADSFVYWKGTSQWLKWDNTNTRFALSSNTFYINNAGAGSAIPDNTGLYIDGVSSTGKTPYLRWIESTSSWDVSHTQYTDGSVIARDILASDGNSLVFNNANYPATDATITVKRPSAATVAIKWNETTERWTTSTDGTTYLNIPNQNLDLTSSATFAGVTINGTNLSFNSTTGAAITVQPVGAAVKWDSTTSRWTTTVDGTNYLNIPNQNLDTTSDVTFSSVVIDGISGFNTQQTTTTSTATVNISATTRRTQKAVIEVVDNVTGNVQVLEALAFQKGTTAYLTTYGEMASGANLATFSANVAGGYIRILATPASTNSTTFTVVRLGMD